MLFVFVCAKWCQTSLEYLSNIAVSYKRQELSILLGMGLVGSVLLIFLAFCVVWVFFLFLRLVSCLPNVAIVSELSNY